jgi:hypothetical protein
MPRGVLPPIPEVVGQMHLHVLLGGADMVFNVFKRSAGSRGGALHILAAKLAAVFISLGQNPTHGGMKRGT